MLIFEIWWGYYKYFTLLRRNSHSFHSWAPSPWTCSCRGGRAPWTVCWRRYKAWWRVRRTGRRLWAQRTPGTWATASNSPTRRRCRCLAESWPSASPSSWGRPRPLLSGNSRWLLCLPTQQHTPHNRHQLTQSASENRILYQWLCAPLGECVLVSLLWTFCFHLCIGKINCKLMESTVTKIILISLG